MKDTTVQALLGIMALLMGMNFNILALASPYWVTGPDFHFGLWEVCYKDSCDPIKNPFVYWKVVQAMLIISVFLFFTSACCCFAAIQKNIVSKAVPVLFAVTGIFVIISMSVFTAKVKIQSPDVYGSSYNFGWMSFFVAFLEMVVSIIQAATPKYQPVEKQPL